MTSGSPEFDVISGKAIDDVVRNEYVQIERIVAETYLSHYKKMTVNPDSYFLRFKDKPDSRIIALPAHISGQDSVSGIKWISSYPSNLKRNIPRASAVLILNDTDTGYPYACLEASIISAARTASSAVLGAYRLNNRQRQVNRLGVIGAGLISSKIIEFFVGTGWRIDELLIYDNDVAFATSLKESVEKKYSVSSCVLTSASELIAGSELVVLATTAAAPYISELEVFEHNPLVLNISLRDLSPEIILASHNVVDDIDHCLKANTSPHLAEQHVGNRAFIHSALFEILDGQPPPSNDKPIVYSPFGMGILDIALGKFIYERAKANNDTTVIGDFFYQMTRH